MQMLLLLLLPLMRLSRSALGELEDLGEFGELGAEVEPDMSDFDLDIVSCSFSFFLLFLRTYF